MRFATCLVLAALSLASRVAFADGADPELTYEQHVRPILKAHCFQCHGEDGQLKGGLDLRLKRLIEAGGESGPAIVAGKPDQSLIVERIRSGEMPPVDKKLSAAEIDAVVRWIAGGAKTARPEPNQIGAGPEFTDEERNYWAFRPVCRPTVPPVEAKPDDPSAAALVRTPIDGFLLARLARERLAFSPEADKATFLRRASFDLVGFPRRLRRSRLF